MDGRSAQQADQADTLNGLCSSLRPANGLCSDLNPQSAQPSRGPLAAAVGGGEVSPSTARPLLLLCVSAALALLIVLWSLQPAGELARTASAYPKSRLDMAVALGADPGMLSSPPHRPALLAAASLACGLSAAAVLLRRRRPAVLTLLAIAAAGAELLCIILLFELAGRGVDLGLAYKAWQSPQAELVRAADRELRLCALALLMPLVLAGSAGILAFARRRELSVSAP